MATKLLLDSTLRDGRYIGGWRSEVTQNVVGALQKSGIALIEIGPELGLGDHSSRRFTCSSDVMNDIEVAATVKCGSALGAFFIPGIGSEPDLKMACTAGLDFVRIGQNPSAWRTVLPFVESALEIGLDVYFNLMKSYLLSPSEIADIAGEFSGYQLKGFYIVDSAGSMTPQDVAGYVRALCASKDIDIGFHGHNNLGLANANSITAWNEGATITDATVRGIGRGGGNASTEQLLAYFSRSGVIDPLMIEPVLDLAVELEKIVDPLKQRFANEDLYCGLYEFHSSWLPTIEIVARDVGVRKSALIAAVARSNRENPTEELIRAKAHEILNVST